MILSSKSIQAERARRDFSLFAKLAWHELEPSTELIWNWHLDAICVHLQAVYNREITRLIIGIAPGHAKSTFVSQLWPVWCWINDPYSRWLCASHSLDLAIRDNRYRRRLIESEWFQERYGYIFKFAPDQRVKGYYENSCKGYQMAVAVRASGTGKRATHLLIDDAHNAMEGEVNRKAVLEWYSKTWISRLNDREKGPMVTVGQRIHSEDLIGYLLELGGSEHLCLPTEYDSTRKAITKIGWSDPRSEDGALLWPEKYPHAVLDELKKDSVTYAAQYQQLPMPAGGGQFRQEWFRYFTETEDAYILETSDGTRTVYKPNCRLFATGDLAISSKETADYTVFAIWAMTPERDLLLLKLVRVRMGNPEQLKQLRLLYQEFPQLYTFKIEKVGYQLALIQQALSEGIPCSEYQPVRDKVSRASTASVWMENGKFYFRKHAHWLPPLESELLLFPRDKHDDIVDNISMAADEATTANKQIKPVQFPSNRTNDHTITRMRGF